MANGFDPNKFLEFANHLINDGDYERDCRARTAIGRIYYAPFLLMLQKFSEKGVSIKEREKSISWLSRLALKRVCLR